MAETAELSGLKKAAILLVSLEQQIAGDILKNMDVSQIEEISREIAAMGPVAQVVRDEVVQEFYTLALARTYADEGGWEYAKTLLAKSLPADEAKKIIDQVNQSIQSAPFAFLQKAESENLLTFIQEEHPQTIALILAHLKPTKASEILVGAAGAEAGGGGQADCEHGADEPGSDQGSRARAGESAGGDDFADV